MAIMDTTDTMGTMVTATITKVQNHTCTMYILLYYVFSIVKMRIGLQHKRLTSKTLKIFLSLAVARLPSANDLTLSKRPADVTENRLRLEERLIGEERRKLELEQVSNIDQEVNH